MQVSTGVNECGEAPGYQVVYSRYEDGALPVRVYGEGVKLYEICDPSSETPVEAHTSVRGLLTRLQGQDRHWSFDRYFMQGKWSRDPSEGSSLTVLNLFSGRREKDQVISVSPCTVNKALTVTPSTDITVLGPVHSPLDFANRSKEIAKLLFKQFGRVIRVAGWDEDDVLQEVYMGLLARNRPGMKSMWNPHKASFGTYVVLVCRSILSNYRRKMERVGRIKVGVKGFVNGDCCDIDVAASPNQVSAMWQGPVDLPDTETTPDATTRLLAFFEARIIDPLSCMWASMVLPLLAKGYGQREIQRATGLKRVELADTREIIEHYSTMWQQCGCP